MDEKFVNTLMAIGIISYREQETVWQIAKRCAMTSGVPMAGAGALMGAKMGTITIPGYGTIAGSVAGALAGLFSGTVTCTMVNVSMRKELKKLAIGE
jgi:hypothetical protein